MGGGPPIGRGMPASHDNPSQQLTVHRYKAPYQVQTHCMQLQSRNAECISRQALYLAVDQNTQLTHRGKNTEFRVCSHNAVPATACNVAMTSMSAWEGFH